MSMRWDPPLARAVARALHAALAGARVRALLLDGEGRRVLLHLREATLAVELHPTAGWITLLEAADPAAEARPLAARVVGVEALPDESGLTLGLERVRGRDEGVELVLEFAGNRWNALVVGYRSRTLRSVLVPGNARGRTLSPGAPWSPLPTGGRQGGAAGPPLDRARFEALAAGGRGSVLRGVAGASSLNVERLLAPDGWAFFQSLHDPGAWGGWITPSPKGRIAYPVPLDDGAEPHPSLLEAMAALRAEADATPPEGLLLSPTLRARADRVLENLERRTRSLERELSGAPDPAPLRSTGDLLLARFDQVRPGADSVTLEGFDGEPVEVSLDPALPVQANARRYYDRAGRAERARAELPERIRRARVVHRELRELLDQVLAGTAEPPALERALAATDPGGRAGRKRQGSGADAAPALPYRSFRSSGGLEIRVGRGARKNDDLTFRHAAPDDIWLHVRQVPGAHVILRWGRDGNPPARDLAEAAGLAALHSDARHSGMVPVDWTRRKHVRKPRKAAPGAVLPQRVQTLFVEPDPGLPDRLAP
jgi:hypothetical protein